MMRDSPGGENAASDLLLKHKHKRALVSTDVHLGDLLIPSSIIPFPSFIRQRMSRKQEEGSQRKRGSTDSYYSDFLPEFQISVSTTFKNGEQKHFSLILLKMKNTYK